MIDQHDLEDRLTDAFAWRADHTVVERAPRVLDAPRRVEVGDTSHTRGRVLVTAAAVLLAVVASFAVVATRGDNGGVGSTPSAPTVTTALINDADFADGRLGLDASTGFTVLSAEDWLPSGFVDPETMTAVFPTRVYATDSANPESGPALVIYATPSSDDGYVPAPPDGSIDVVIGDGTGALFDRPGGQRGLQLSADGYYYQVTTYNMTDAEIVAAAESMSPSPDGNGAAIDASALPAGVSEQLVGWSESLLVSVTASEVVAPRAEFGHPETGVRATYLSYADPGLFRLNRLAGFARLTPADVNGAPGYVGSYDDPAFATVVWQRAGRTFVLTGEDEVQLLELARSLHPVSDEEWAAMTATTDGLLAPCLPVDCAPTTVRRS